MRAGTNSADTLPRSKRVCFRSKLIVSDEEVEDSSEDSQHEDDTNESDFEQEGDTQQQEPDGKTVAGGQRTINDMSSFIEADEEDSEDDDFEDPEGEGDESAEDEGDASETDEDLSVRKCRVICSLL